MEIEHSKPWRIVYTDPMWALTEDGEIDPRRADIEMQIYGHSTRLDLGVHDGQDFVRRGPLLNERLSKADAVVIYRTQITEEIVDVLRPNCKVVARQGVGVDNLNAGLLKRAGIFAFNISDYCVEEVSTHTLSIILALERGICRQDDHIKNGKWGIFFGGVPRRLSGLTLGIVGYGRIGRATSRKAQVFYERVIAWDPYVHDDLMQGYGVKKSRSLSDLLQQSDVVVLHCALTDETRAIINERTIPDIKPGALLINTARGALVQPAAVLWALENGRLGGYGSDVFTPENPNEDPVNKRIVQFNNVIVTSHRAFLSQSSEISQRARLATQVHQVLTTGLPPQSDRVA
ncbi:MAG TPA: C-terminal binding protein [Stellaceae bacterium]|nr:C-terminal binding protein [Stellaceae bacterium]